MLPFSPPTFSDSFTLHLSTGLQSLQSCPEINTNLPPLADELSKLPNKKKKNVTKFSSQCCGDCWYKRREREATPLNFSGNSPLENSQLGDFFAVWWSLVHNDVPPSAIVSERVWERLGPSNRSFVEVNQSIPGFVKLKWFEDIVDDGGIPVRIGREDIQLVDDARI